MNAYDFIIGSLPNVPHENLVKLFFDLRFDMDCIGDDDFTIENVTLCDTEDIMTWIIEILREKEIDER